MSNSNNKDVKALACTICMEPYQSKGDHIPRTLTSCGHTFCTSCLEALCIDDKIVCPTCRKETAVSSVAQLNKAFALLDLMDAVADNPEAVKSAAQDALVEQKAAPAASTSASDHVQLSIVAAPDADNNDQTAHNVLVTMKPPYNLEPKRTPIDISLVLDVSGSMCATATMKNQDGKDESHGLSLLDVVKHAARTVIGMLTETDRLSLVSYSSRATLELPLTCMDATGKALAEAALDGLHPNGMTNLWDGLKTGMDSLDTTTRNLQAASQVLLLTDGQPNQSPASGEIVALQRYQKKHPNLQCSISTFGFGYSIAYELLNDIARVGCGNYVFVPDSSFVGTAFVNAVATSLTTIAQKCVLTLTPQNGAEFVDLQSTVDGHDCVKKPDGSIDVKVNSLVHGTPRHVVLQMTLSDNTKSVNEPFLNGELTFVSTGTLASKHSSASAVGYVRDAVKQVQVQEIRSRVVRQVTQLSLVRGNTVPPETRDKLSQLASNIAKSSSFKTNEFVRDLHKDLTGQIAEAFSKDSWWKRWGKYYVASICRSHCLEVCSNFKDASLQGYAGKLFGDLQEIGDELFCALPPPKPAAPPKEVIAAMGSSYVPPSRPQVSMARYHTSCGPCVHGDSLVTMASGAKKAARMLSCGDVVRVDATSTQTATVQCVVETKMSGNTNLLCRLPSGLRVTPYHPVHWNNEWQFPLQIVQPTLQPCDAIVSILLHDQKPSVLIDDVPVIAFNHGLTHNAVVRHEFFGTPKVVAALQQLTGFGSGRIVLRDDCVVRDSATGLVIGFRQ